MVNLLECCDWPDIACRHGDQVMLPGTNGGIDANIALRVSCQAAGSIMIDSKAGTDCRSSHLVIVTHNT